MANKAGPGRPKIEAPDWPARACKICGGRIPFYDKKGKLMTRWKYQKRKTCSNRCYGELHAQHRRAKEPLPEPTALDKFIYGAYRYDG